MAEVTALRGAVARSPWLYCAIARRKPGRNRQVVSRGTDLLVESFPRSGTTYLVAALKVTAPSLQVASHVHHPAHVRLAQRYGIPSVVLVREPLAACASLAIYRDRFSAASVLQEWIDYYEPVARLGGVQVIEFQGLTRRTIEALELIGRLVDVQFDVSMPDLDERIVQEINRMTMYRHGEIDPLRVSRPTEEREERKVAVRQQLEWEGAAELAAARQLYQRILR
jgi:hypothetical protein